MTSVLAPADTAPASPSPSNAGRARPLLAALPWLLALAVLVAGLLDTGTAPRDIAVYAAYLVFGVAVPGTLVHRALRGSRGNLPEDLGLGAATGLPLQLLGWALTAATGLQSFLIAWPLLIIVLFLAVPRLRRNWRIAEPRPLPPAWSWIVAGGLILAVLMNYPNWQVTPLPPADVTYYQDYLYHLSLVHEMMRSMPFQVPQLAGETLRYHYLSDADMAAGSLITRISPVVILFRLWFVPVVAISVLVFSAIGREITGRWWAGALAGPAGILGVPLSLGAVDAFGGVPVNAYSPSQTYVFPLLGLLALLVIDVLRGRRLGWAWFMVFPLALACAGSKSSALPPLIAGLVLAVIALAFVDRTRLKPALAFLGLALAAMAAGARLFAGGGAGILGIQPLAILFWFAPYKQTVAAGESINGSGLLPPGLADASATGLAFTAGVIGWWLLAQTSRLAGLALAVNRRTMRDPVVWLLTGVILAGTGAAWCFWHPAASQLYFFGTVIPFGIVLTLWLLTGRRGSMRPVLAGAVAGALWILVVPRPRTPKRPSYSSWAWALAEPVLLTAAVAAVVAVIGLLVWRRRTGRTAWRAIPIALVAAALAAGLSHQVDHHVRANVEALSTAPKPPKDMRAILPDEARAALWLDDHAGQNDIVATNVHCTPLNWRAACDARAFWVAGLGGRRTVVESWGYTDQAVAQDGVGGKRYNLQPAPFPERFALNERVFAKGDPADVTRLKEQFHVRWLFADSRAASGVSPELAKVAQVRYQAGPVTIYELS